jgi:hypothetical protein
MPLFVKTSGTSSSSTWPKVVSISVKTAISTWVKAKSAFVRTAAGWIQFFPKSGPYTTTFPYFASTTTGTSPIAGLTLDTGSTVYLQKGTWLSNGYTISSYSYYVYTTSNGNINTTASQYNAASGTLTQYATIPLSAAIYDGYYIYGEIDANTTTTGVTGIETTDGNGSRYFVCRKYIPTQSAYTPTINYSYNAATSVTTLAYVNKWNGTADYLPDNTRSAILWYRSTVGTYTSVDQIIANATYVSSTTPSISNDGTLYTVNASLTLNPAIVGNYYYAVNYEYNSKSDWNVYQYGSASPSAYAKYGPINSVLTTNPAYGTPTSSSNGFNATISTAPNPTGGSYSYYTQTGTGTVTVNSTTGAVSVTGMSPGNSVTVYVYYTLYGYVPYLFIVTGTATPNYTVTWNANGGSVTPSSSTVASGSTVTAPTPTRDGYTFLQWRDTPSGDYTYGLNAGSSWTVTGNILFYARWIPNYTITWNANGGTVTPTSSTAASGSTVTAPTPTRDGYTFLQWRDTPSGDYTYGLNAGGSWTVTANALFYARWTVVSAAPTGGSVSVSPASGAVGTQFSAVPSGWSGTPSTFTYTYSWQHQSSFFSWVQDGTGSTFTPTQLQTYGYRLAWTVSNGISPNATGTTSFTVTASTPPTPPVGPPTPPTPPVGPPTPPTPPVGPPYFPPPYFSPYWSDYRLKENVEDHEQ